MKTISRDLFLTPVAVEIKEVEIPAMGGVVYVKGFTAAERTAFETSMQDKHGNARMVRKKQIRQLLIIKCVTDEKGNRLFTEADLDRIGAQPANLLEPLVEACMVASGLLAEDIDAMGNDSEATTEDK